MTDRDLWIRRLRDTAGARASRPRRIADLCVQMLGVTGAGMSLVSDSGDRGVLCATDVVSERIEELQVTLGEGPCIDTFRTGAPVLVPDLQDLDDIAVWRWPTFMAAAAEAGVQAVFAFPLQIGAIRLGALDMYRSHAGALDDDELAAALLGAEAAAVALLGLDGVEPGDLTDGEGTDASHQAQVHQATGMVMVQLDVTVEQAFLFLRARAFSTGRPLNELAVDIVEHRVRFSAEDR